jgi:hypothetical protein
MLVVADLSIIVVRGGKADFLVGLLPSLSRSTLESLTLKPSCLRFKSVRVRSVVIRVSRLAVRPIVLPIVLPTVPRVVSFGARKLVVLFGPIVLREESPGLPIREVDFASGERRLVSDFFFTTDNDGSLVPMKLPIRRSR